MKIEKLSICKEKALEEIENYNKAIKTSDAKYTKQMKKMYKFLSEGKKIINIYDVFANAPIENRLPKIAIARADADVIIFRRGGKGSGSFGVRSNSQTWGNPLKIQVHLPKGTFKFRHTKDAPKIAFKTKVPVIPGHLIPKGKLSNYYILWEVENWTQITLAPKDPYLLKRISTNIFAVLSSWNLTPLERAITSGR